MSAPTLLSPRPAPTPAPARATPAPARGSSAVLMALRDRAALVCDAELRRLATRVPELDARSHDEVGRAVQRVVDAFFGGDLGRRVARDARLADALRVLFSLDPSGGRS
ncbi:hypothetical protein [Nonomuraea typhae]|uniref:hypothetical protein n=1 Tax=Nonomuraea typhae TaxID=2603600 RepID=UPI0012F84227|nr:hypothetical protein [Nonomuraea typhae]